MSRELTIGQLAKQHNLSRSTLLYYDRLGLLHPRNRSAGNYRSYSVADAERLTHICRFRRLGVPLKEIAHVLDGAQTAGQTASILRRRLAALATEIEAREEQQRQIVGLLVQLSAPASAGKRTAGTAPRAVTRGILSKNSRKKESLVIDKQRWVEIMRAAGFTEEAMRAWHQQFEQMEPQAHQEFLESLRIPAEEIVRIRERSAAC